MGIVKYLFYLFFFYVVNFSVSYAADFEKLRKQIEKLSPGEWLELPQSNPPLFTKNEVINIQDEYGGGNIWGSSGSKSVLEAWSGAAFDGRRWWFFGGGHRDYGGNEVYQFDFSSLSWKRLTSPSPLTGPNMPYKAGMNCPMPADGPSATHTYDAITWNPVSKSIWLIRPGGYCFKGRFSQIEKPFWEFDPELKKWIRHDSHGIFTGYAMSEWNPETKRIAVIPKFYSGESVGPFELDERGNIHRRGNIRFGVMPGIMAYDSNNHTMYTTDKKMMRKLELSGEMLGNWKADSKFPQAMIDAGVRQGGMIFNSSINSFIFWTGQRIVWSWNVDTKEFRQYSNSLSETAPDGSRLVFSKWIYLPEFDVYAGLNNHEHGIWIYKLGGDSQILNPDEPRACLNNQCNFTSIGDAFLQAEDGDQIKILPGSWAEGAILKADNVTIKAADAVLTKAFANKAALVIKGNNTAIEGLECKNIKVSDGNGACIRLKGKNLTLKNVYFHHNQQGVLTGSDSGKVVIEDSRIEYNGNQSHPLGRSHGVYIAGDTLKIRRSKIIGTGNEGHEVKSRTRVTVIEESVVASVDAKDSRLIDIPNGGKVIVKNSILQHGKNTGNQQLIGFGWERGKRGIDWEENELILDNNMIIMDNNDDQLFAARGENVQPVVSGNLIIGGKNVYEGNCYFENRETAKIPDYPDIDFPFRQCKDQHSLHR